MRSILIGLIMLALALVTAASPAVILGGRRGFRRPFRRPFIRRPFRGVGLGLAFAGGYVAGSARGNYYNNNYYYNSPDYYGYGYPYNGCYNCYYGKKKRSIPDEINRNQLEKMFKEISQVDTEECGLFLLCELAERPITHLGELELTILAPFRGDIPSDGTFYGKYNEAVWRGKNMETCSEVYASCDLTADDIIEGIKEQEDDYITELDSQNEDAFESTEPPMDFTTNDQ